MMSKSRTELKSYFKKHSIPTQKNFEDLIDSMLNQYDDGIVKTAGNPLQIDVMSGAANDYINAQFTLSGGGKVTWGGPGGRLKWESRMIASSMERGKSFADGRINIIQPTTDIPAANVYDNQARSATTEGVTLNRWDALYAVHPVGGSVDSISRFEIRNYTTEFSVPGNWILVAVVNGDDNTVKIGTGAIISANTSSSPGSSLPTGVIVMWSGSSEQIPGGWVLCDGADGTPDLQDRFVVAAGTTYPTHSAGGAATVRLTPEQMPSHSHAVNDRGHTHSVTPTVAMHSQSFSGASGTDLPLKNKTAGKGTSFKFTAAKKKTGVSIANEGGGQPHENMPPFFALCFIMKL